VCVVIVSGGVCTCWATCGEGVAGGKLGAAAEKAEPGAMPSCLERPREPAAVSSGRLVATPSKWGLPSRFWMGSSDGMLKVGRRAPAYRKPFLVVP